jgi:hypothetical protein
MARANSSIPGVVTIPSRSYRIHNAGRIAERSSG